MNEVNDIDDPKMDKNMISNKEDTNKDGENTENAINTVDDTNEDTGNVVEMLSTLLKDQNLALGEVEWLSQLPLFKKRVNK